jgi:hypothetical protein
LISENLFPCRNPDSRLIAYTVTLQYEGDAYSNCHWPWWLAAIESFFQKELDTLSAGSARAGYIHGIGLLF